MMKKKTMRVVFIFIIIVSLSGCGNNSSNEEKEVSSEIITEEEVDNTEPEIELSNDILSCKTGEKIQFDKYFKVSDDLDDTENIKTEIDDSKVDYNNPGKYTVTVTATDVSNNSAKANLDLYVYKDYECEELKEILNKLKDEKYYDFEVLDDCVDTPEYKNLQFEMNDGTAATDSLLGLNDIIGYIDWIACYASLDVSVSQNNSHKNDNVSWNSEILVNLIEYTNYGTIQDISKVEIVSKNGKIALSNPEDVLSNCIRTIDEPDYKVRNVGFCFPTEQDLERFESIINGINPTIVFISDAGNEITRIKMSDVDIVNYKSAINLYHDINKYICYVPKVKNDISSSTDATSTDADE